MSVTINGTSGLVFNDASTQNTSAFTGGFAMRNRIINGAMVISQRNAGASVTGLSQYTLDRWYSGNTQSSKYSVEQTVTGVAAPTGFTDYLAVTSSSAYSVLTGDTFWIQQPIEGFNTADLAWGTASAATVTLSFWVRSSLTGTFGGAFTNSATNRSYPFSYTISSANTWEQKTVTVAGDTSGTWLTNNGSGIVVRFGLGSGSTYSGTAGAWAAANYVQPTSTVSVVGTNAATWYITGVQLEKGSTATSFDYRPYTTELQLCQRYLPAFSSSTTASNLGVGQTVATTAATCVVAFPVQTRVAPTGITISSASHFSGTTPAGGQAAFTGLAFNASNLCSGEVYGTGATGLAAAGGCSILRANSTSALLLFTGCEL
jgi:hypothetical protein